jgi:hypothetical protein
MQARRKRKWLETIIVADKTDTLASVSEALLTTTVTLAGVSVNVWGRCTDQVVIARQIAYIIKYMPSTAK